jgi:cytochrome o ubiquinol oxidase subunit 1
MSGNTTLPNDPLIGRISWDAVPMAHEPIVLWTFIAVVLGGLVMVAA